MSRFQTWKKENNPTCGLFANSRSRDDRLQYVELRYDGYHSVGEAAAQRAQELVLAHVEALRMDCNSNFPPKMPNTPHIVYKVTGYKVAL